MRAVNLFLLTRTHEHGGVSLTLNVMSGRDKHKEVSAHEAATLWSLTDNIARYLSGDQERFSDDWLSLLDGFFFSYVIEHIGKEFDLLKASADGRCILNIELKSEQVEEGRIKKQLDQNRYYLSHIAHTIYSFTYVMETDRIYSLDDGGILSECGIEEIARALLTEEFRDYLRDGIESCFRAAEYLISPIASPDKFLQGKYFLTNQQFEFRRRIIRFLQDAGENDSRAVVISISGIAGTGKTLLLLDLAVKLSDDGRVVFIHSGPLRKGHFDISSRLEKVDIISGSSIPSDEGLAEYGYVCVDEADHLGKEALGKLLDAAEKCRIPVILSYDPHRLLPEAKENPGASDMPSDVKQLISNASALELAFTGNIRINRPVYSFLRTLLCLKDHSSGQNYGCIDVLYANDAVEQILLEDYYRKRGYVLVSSCDGAEKEDDIIAREYDKIIMVLDETYYYDENLHLRAHENEEKALRLLYEGLSRTREKLCLLVTGNRELYMRILAIRAG